MWTRLAALLAAAAVAGCQPSLKISSEITSVGAGKHRVVLYTPRWELPNDVEPLMKSDEMLAERHAASLCEKGFGIAREEYRAGQRCDMNCKAGNPAFETRSVWLVTCRDAA